VGKDFPIETNALHGRPTTRQLCRYFTSDRLTPRIPRAPNNPTGYAPYILGHRRQYQLRREKGGIRKGSFPATSGWVESTHDDAASWGPTQTLRGVVRRLWVIALYTSKVHLLMKPICIEIFDRTKLIEMHAQMQRL